MSAAVRLLLLLLLLLLLMLMLLMLLMMLLMLLMMLMMLMMMMMMMMLTVMTLMMRAAASPRRPGSLRAAWRTRQLRWFAMQAHRRRRRPTSIAWASRGAS